MVTVFFITSPIFMSNLSSYTPLSPFFPSMRSLDSSVLRIYCPKGAENFDKHKTNPKQNTSSKD